MNSEAINSNNSKLRLIKGNSLSCKDFEYLHQDYLDEEMDDQLMCEMKHHHKYCPDCQSYAEDIEYLITQAKLLLKERPLPADTKQRIYQKLNQEFDLQLA